MQNTSYIALSRQAALSRHMDAIANNMANANTVGYKGEKMMFAQYLVRSPSEQNRLGDKIAFVHDVGLVRDTRQGSLTHTNDPLDVALNGDGYMVVDTPAGQRYTRAGHFRMDETGMLVTPDGYPVLQQGDQPIVFAPNETRIEIGNTGQISTENGAIGRLKVVRFENPQQLENIGGGLYATTAQSEDVARPDVVQGAVEESNVQPIQEMTDMITVQRNYEAVTRVLENEQDRQLKAFQVLNKTA